MLLHKSDKRLHISTFLVRGQGLSGAIDLKSVRNLTENGLDEQYQDAELYDIHQDVPGLETEKKYYRSLVKTYGSRVLEACCGTGIFSLDLAYNAEASVVGVDIAQEMLQRARSKDVENKVQFVLGDCTTLDCISEKDFDICVLTGNSIQALQSNEQVFSLLRSIWKKLRKGGVFTLESRLICEKILKNEKHLRKFSLPDGRRLECHFVQESFDSSSQLSQNKNTFKIFKDEKLEKEVAHHFQLRFFGLQELIFFLNQAGFQNISLCSSYDGKELLGNDAYVVIKCFKP